MTATSDTAPPTVSLEPASAPIPRDREGDPAVLRLSSPHDLEDGADASAEPPHDHGQEEGRGAAGGGAAGGEAAGGEAAAGGWRARVVSALRRIVESPLPRALRRQTLTAPGGVLLALLVLLPGVLIDAATDGTLGRPTVASFVLAGLACTLTVRRGALGTAAVLPPLLFATAAVTIAWASGQNHSTRQLVLDAGTTLALSAPAVFTGTGLVLAVVLGRLGWGMLRRR